MSPVLMVLLLFVVMFIWVFLGVPYVYAIGIAAVLILGVGGFGLPLTVLVRATISTIDSWVWLAVPLFVMLGFTMSASGITKHLVRVASALVGHIRGGLSHVAVVTNTLMAGMSGSILADASATGVLLIPVLKENGYSRGYASAVIACAAMIGPLIPPSMNLIICGVLVDVSILRLWIGGIVPGLMVGASLIIIGFILAKRRGYPVGKWGGIKPLARSTGSASPALVIPIVILGGMRLGVFTPTEAGAAGVVYVLFVAFVIYREMKFKDLLPPIVATVRLTSMVAFVVAVTGSMGYMLAILQAGPIVAKTMLSLTDSPTLFLFLVMGFVLLMGMFMDGIPLMLILIPILVPSAVTYGIDLIHFGLVFSYCILIGSLTPPFGLTMFVTTDIAGASIREYLKDGWPLLAGNILLVFPLILYPPLVTWLPTLVMG